MSTGFSDKETIKEPPSSSPTQTVVWCQEETSFRRMVDLKDHVMARHGSKIELMPNSFLTENNGFWMANYPEVYARVISPSNENSVQAMKARIEVLEFLTKANHTARTKEQWILGWKCSKELIK